jgi:hypothetical protein
MMSRFSDATIDIGHASTVLGESVRAVLVTGTGWIANRVASDRDQIGIHGQFAELALVSITTRDGKHL